MRGRKPFGPEIVDLVEGSEEAKKRVRAILETMIDLPMQDCSERLGLCPQRVDQLRWRMVAAAVQSLEPGQAGRPRHDPDPNAADIEILEARIRDLETELRAGQIREEIALKMPHLIHPQGELKKKLRRG